MKALWNLLMRVGMNVLKAWIPILMDELGTFYAAIKPQAIDIVRGLAKQADWDNDKKAKMAVALLMEAAKTQGLRQSESLVKASVEAAWREVKKEIAAQATKKD